MTEHTKTDGMPAMDGVPDLQFLERSAPRNERMAGEKVECNACPVLCQISPDKTGACDRYANASGVLVRVDPVVMCPTTSPLQRTFACSGPSQRSVSIFTLRLQ